MYRILRYYCLCFSVFTILFNATAFSEEPKEKEVLAAMRKASDFMVNKVSCHGGYVWNYAADLSNQWGEPPARPTQIWTHSGTPSVGETFLEAYKVTGDNYYLECAEKAANALIWGQHPLGGWHYFIDFDVTGIEQWYRDVASHFKWGMEEYRHYYGNCTFDDDATQGPTRFLLRLYMTTLDPKYRGPLLRALNFFLISQYSNGGWPQRYPLRYEFTHDGLPDYTSCYTLNDRVICNNIDVLFEAYEKLGNDEYRKAAIRGIEFLMLAQGPGNQAGWAEQYSMDIEPAWGRTHEYPSYMTSVTARVVRELGKYYVMTGDRRFLKPIPGAIKWLEECTFEILTDGRNRMPQFLTVGDNLPVYRFQTDKVTNEGYGVYHWSFDDSTGVHPFYFAVIDVKGLKREYKRLNALSPEGALAEYAVKKFAKPIVPKVNSTDVSKLISSMDERGAWVEEVIVFKRSVTIQDYSITDHVKAPIQGISTRSFVRNMQTFINYLKSKNL